MALQKQHALFENIDFEKLFSALSPGPLFIIEQNGNVILENTKSKEAFHLSRGDNLFTIVDEACTQKFKDDLIQCEKHQKTVTSLLKTNEINGKFFYYMYYINYFKNNLFFINFIDQTEVNNKIITLNNIINTVPDPILVKNEQHEFIYVNQAFSESLNLTSSDMIGKTDYDFYPKDECDVYRKLDRLTFKTGSSINEESYTDKKLGKRIISTKKAVFKTFDGSKILVGVIRDISELKEARELLKKQAKELQRQVTLRTEQLQIKTNELEQAIEGLKNLNSDLDCFAHICCHELRAPLRTISSFSALVLEEYALGETANIKNYLATIHDRVLKMDTLMKSILEYSTNGLNKNAMSCFSLHDLLNEITFVLDVQIQEKNVSITYDNMPNIHADRLQYFQLFQNLINNSIKFSVPSVTPMISILAKKTDNFIEFQVKDNGLGIAKKFHKELFLPFKKFHTRAEGSMYGIGLSLCKKIVENHGGTIKMSSHKNIGTTFTFTLPIK
jgi:PAS domain S-box-containing protein